MFSWLQFIQNINYENNSNTQQYQPSYNGINQPFLNNENISIQNNPNTVAHNNNSPYYNNVQQNQGIYGNNNTPYYNNNQPNQGISPPPPYKNNNFGNNQNNIYNGAPYNVQNANQSPNPNINPNRNDYSCEICVFVCCVGILAFCILGYFLIKSLGKIPED